MKPLFALIASCSLFSLLAACTGSQAAPNNDDTPSATAETVPPTSEPTATAVPSATPLPTATPAPTPTRTAGDARVDDLGIEQVWVPPGTFQRGTADIEDLEPPAWASRELKSEQPQHEVELTSGYWMDKYEVTNAAYDAFIEAGGYENQAVWSEAGWQWLSRQNPENLPVACGESVADLPRVCVTWFEAEAYARWRGGRLPTEAEWEYAARGPESLIYPWGDTFDEMRANVVGSSGLTAVGSYPDGVSWTGLHDMAGNAMEWVQDWLDWDHYELEERVDPQGPASGRIKIEKGGWWGSNPFVARSAYRHFEDPPTYQDHHIGFRIVSPASEDSP